MTEFIRSKSGTTNSLVSRTIWQKMVRAITQKTMTFPNLQKQILPSNNVQETNQYSKMLGPWCKSNNILCITIEHYKYKMSKHKICGHPHREPPCTRLIRIKTLPAGPCNKRDPIYRWGPWRSCCIETKPNFMMAALSKNGENYKNPLQILQNQRFATRPTCVSLYSLERRTLAFIQPVTANTCLDPFLLFTH